ncbi:MAG: hypothetical protein JWO06_2216 [Bacteroidota bacterium]|nr:hypothetical protein [Bacteroidota bacterium]
MSDYKYLNGLLSFNLGTLVVELTNDPTYSIDSVDNNFTYDFAYRDEESNVYGGSRHVVKILSDGKIIQSAIVCGAGGGGTMIHPNSAVMVDAAIIICCSNKLFSLSLPDLRLNWLTAVDIATCFGIYKADGGLFTHGELTVARINMEGQIIWQTGLRDIIVNIEENRTQNEFVMHDNYINLMDFKSNTYQLDFNGKFIGEQISEEQKQWDLWLSKINRPVAPWWKFWK